MFKDIFITWKNKSDLAKLQYMYVIVFVALLVVAGLVGLLNQQVSWQVLSVAWIAVIAFFTNFLAFAVINLVAPSVPDETVPVSKKRPRSRK